MEKFSIDTIIIGAGQAGLATSYHQSQQGKENLVLEKADIPGHVWRVERWDSFNLVRLPVTDSYGFPNTKRGVTDYPGLFFMGMPWLYKFKSGFLFGVGEDAAHIASLISSAH
ncbi:MAG: hypothetical protein A2Z16_03835 [Chloroflexi bacterium RBG_16_54_18]|nr:MAG: hypothetical protein A2Z16_03835 [Chloroflexi bacterium RBG_16_54_18]